MASLNLPRAFLFLAVFWAGIYLPGLGNEELKGEEPRRALPGLTMIRTGDWLRPVVAGEAYHRKPPLANWLAAAGVLATGRVDEFSVRWPVVVLVLCLSLALCAGVARAANVEAGFLAGIFALTNIGMMEKGRLIEIEGAYIALTGMAFAAWLAFAAPALAPDSPRRRPWLGWLLAGPLLGLAFLAKGPAHLVVFYGVACAVWWRTGRMRYALHPAHGAGILAFLATGLPWFLATRAGALDKPAAAPSGGSHWLGELTSRLDPGAMDFPSWFLQLFQGVANFLPWCLPLLVLGIPALRRRFGLECDNRLVAGLFAGCALAYLAIALTPAARARFTLPVIAPAAAALALALATGSRTGAVLTGWSAGVRASIYGIGLVAVCLPWFVAPGARAGCAIASVCALALCLLARAIERRWRQHPVNLAVAASLVMVAVTALYAGGIQPIKARSEELRPTGQAVLALLAAGERAVLYRADLQPWVFYGWGRIDEVSARADLPLVLSGPLILPADRRNKEINALVKRYGPVSSESRLPNPWNNKDLLVLRFAGPPDRVLQIP